MAGAAIGIRANKGAVPPNAKELRPEASQRGVMAISVTVPLVVDNGDRCVLG